MKYIIATFLTVVFYLTANGLASVSIVGVSFGPQAGPTGWTTETNKGSGTVTNLIAEDGSKTNIDLSYSVTGTAELYNVALTASTVPTHTPSLAGLDGNIDTLSNGTFTASFNNLAPSTVYDLWVLVDRENISAGQSVVITGAATVNFTQSDSRTNDLILNSSIGNNAEDFDSYSLPIAASAAGTIEVGIAGSSADGFAISGLAISVSPVPEPSPGGLVLFGLFAERTLGFRRRLGQFKWVTQFKGVRRAL